MAVTVPTAVKINPVHVIINNAPKFGLDPVAVLAYALEEGGLKWGAVGDNGTSFGPFQAHIGGANPYRDPNQASGWANSPRGLIQMMGMMSRTSARGKKGKDAVRAIEIEFGRGADPEETVRRAYAKMGQAQRVYGSAAAPLGKQLPPSPQRSVSGAPDAPVRPQEAPQAPLAVNAGPVAVPLPVKATEAVGPLIGELRGATLPVKVVTGTKALPPVSRKPVAESPPSEKAAHLFGNGVTPKVIGLPFQGTHGKAFNARGGSDNWESENAVDFGIPMGTPVYAIADGTIGSQFGTLGSGGRFAGLRLHLVAKGNEWYYAHLSKFAPGLKPGTKVKKGQLIGFSGEANGVPHLHIAAKNNPLAAEQSAGV